MSEFNPSPHDQFMIGGRQYRVMPHPSVPAFAFGQEGRKAFVYQLSNDGDEKLYALKKFKQAFRVPELVEVCDLLARFATWPGLEVCDRQCLNQKTHQDALDEFPDLEFAVLMPWIDGSTWYDILVGKRAVTKLDALKMANATSQVLSALEESGLAHCDIAAPNVIIDLYQGRAHLIDVEDLYAPGFTPPVALPAGTAGYAHRTAADGLWTPLADRFAGAVLLAEITAWYSPQIREESEEEHYFDMAEMQTDCVRYRLLADALSGITPQLEALFKQAWTSETLEDCPRLNAWYSAINRVFQEEYRREQVAPIVSGWQPLLGMAGLPDGQTQPAAPAPATLESATSAPARPIAILADESSPAPTAQPPRPLIPPAAEPAPGLQAATGGTIGPIKAPPPASPVIEWRPLIVPPVAGSAADQPAPAASPTVAVGLQQPTLIVTVDAHKRPLVEWSESVGAEDYLLQESRSEAFDAPHEYRIKATKRLWVPSRIGWQRADRLYYRIRARKDKDASPWSAVVMADLT